MEGLAGDDVKEAWKQGMSEDTQDVHKRYQR